MRIYAKSILFIAISILATYIPSQAQGLLDGIKLGWTEPAKGAIEEAFYMIRVDYVLEKVETSEQYGKDDEKFFTRSFLVALASEDKLWTEAICVQNPWVGDPAYEPYKDNKEYMPVVSTLAYKNIKNDKYHDLNASVLKTIEADKNGLLAIPIPDDSLKFIPLATRNIGDDLSVFLSQKNYGNNDKTPEYELTLLWSKSVKINGESYIKYSLKEDGSMFRQGIQFTVESSLGQISLFPKGLLTYDKEQDQHWRINSLRGKMLESATLNKLDDEEKAKEDETQEKGGSEDDDKNDNRRKTLFGKKDKNKKDDKNKN